MPEQLTHTEGILFLIVFSVGFTGMLLAGLAVYKVIYRGKFKQWMDKL